MTLTKCRSWCTILHLYLVVFIMGVSYAKMIKSSTRYVKTRIYKNVEEGTFLEKIRNTSWWDVYLTTDVNEAVQLFTTKVTTILDQMAPVKTFQEKKVIIKKGIRLKHFYLKIKLRTNLEKFRKLRNKVTKNLKIINWYGKKRS